MAKLVSLDSPQTPLHQFAEKETVPPAKVPAGYAEIQLSSKGKIGAPETFHMRNFNVSDLTALSLTRTEDLPERIIHMMQTMIFEDADVEKFAEAEVIETLVLLYRNYFGRYLIDAEYPLSKEDYDDVDTLYADNEERRKQMSSDLRTNKWKPRIDIDLDALEYFELDETFKPRATIRSKSTGLEATFGLPRFGDIAVLRRWMKDAYKKHDEEYEELRNKVQLRIQMIKAYRNGSLLDASRIPVVRDEERKALQDYDTEKANVAITASRAIHLLEFDGTDVSNLPIIERMRYIEDPRVDISLMRRLEEYFQGLEIGIRPYINVVSPITGSAVTRRWSFRLVDLLQAITVQNSDDYDIVFS